MRVSTLVTLLPLALASRASPLDRRSQSIGATSSDVFPPASPTNSDDSSFPTDVGHPGPTPTGAEPALIATASLQPKLNDYFPLVNPPTEDKANNFSVIYHMGNLSPMRTLEQNAWGLDTSPEIPKQCTIEQVHLLHRHGARYSTSTGSIASFAGRLHNATLNSTIKATGSLAFLNTWEYKLGSEVLTPFGRLQLFQMGVAFRQRYGFLLDKFTNALPVFRTTSQNRMLYSALNFAAGFFGIPYESQYHQSIIIEDTGFNNSLASYYTCNNSNKAVGTLGTAISTNWSNIYLANATKRLAKEITGYNLTVTDVAAMQQLCSYETVALGYSAFCDLFTEEEFLDYSYYFALSFWYSNSFGNPTAAAVGVGYAQEMLARLTHEHTPVYNTSVNSTLASSDVTNPLNQSIYVDATHDTIVSAVIVALNLTAPAAAGPLPTTHRPTKQTFFVEQIAPFGTQLTAQVLSCGNTTNIRFLLNGAVTPLTGMKGCPKNAEGLCPLSTFVAGLRQRVTEINWAYDCYANYNYTVPKGGGGITGGRPPSAP